MRVRTIVALALTYALLGILMNSVGAVILQSIRHLDATRMMGSSLEACKDLSVVAASFLLAFPQEPGAAGSEEPAEAGGQVLGVRHDQLLGRPGQRHIQVVATSRRLRKDRGRLDDHDLVELQALGLGDGQHTHA